MDIEKIKNKRQLNVQEQNAILKNTIYSEAEYWRNNGLPHALKSAIEEKGISLATSIVLEYEQNFPGCSTDYGIVLTNDGNFYKFEMDLSNDRSTLLHFYIWENINSEIEVNKNLKGTGASWGYLAQEVLNELNDS